jgi:hypothetical protein
VTPTCFIIWQASCLGLSENIGRYYRKTLLRSNILASIIPKLLANIFWVRLELKY